MQVKFWCTFFTKIRFCTVYMVSQCCSTTTSFIFKMQMKIIYFSLSFWARQWCSIGAVTIVLPIKCICVYLCRDSLIDENTSEPQISVDFQSMSNGCFFLTTQRSRAHTVEQYVDIWLECTEHINHVDIFVPRNSIVECSRWKFSYVFFSCRAKKKMRNHLNFRIRFKMIYQLWWNHIWMNNAENLWPENVKIRMKNCRGREEIGREAQLHGSADKWCDFFFQRNKKKHWAFALKFWTNKSAYLKWFINFSHIPFFCCFAKGTVNLFL